MSDIKMLSMFIWFLILASAIIVIYSLLKPSYKRNKLEKLCTAEIDGEIIKVESTHNRDFITVRYYVNKQEYRVREKLKLRYETVASKNILMYRQGVPVIGNYEIGQNLVIKYNPTNPEQAIIRENVSILNI